MKTIEFRAIADGIYCQVIVEHRSTIASSVVLRHHGRRERKFQQQRSLFYNNAVDCYSQGAHCSTAYFHSDLEVARLHQRYISGKLLSCRRESSTILVTDFTVMSQSIMDEKIKWWHCCRTAKSSRPNIVSLVTLEVVPDIKESETCENISSFAFSVKFIHQRPFPFHCIQYVCTPSPDPGGSIKNTWLYTE